MTELNQKDPVLGFSLVHGERLVPHSDGQEELSFYSLREMLSELGYKIETSMEPITRAWLDTIDVLSLGAPQSDLHPEESVVIEHFLKHGGSLLLTVNAETMIDVFFGTETTLGDMLGELTGIELQEYHNYLPTYLQV